MIKRFFTKKHTGNDYSIGYRAELDAAIRERIELLDQLPPEAKARGIHHDISNQAAAFEAARDLYDEYHTGQARA